MVPLAGMKHIYHRAAREERPRSTGSKPRPRSEQYSTLADAGRVVWPGGRESTGREGRSMALSATSTGQSMTCVRSFACDMYPASDETRRGWQISSLDRSCRSPQDRAGCANQHVAFSMVWVSTPDRVMPRPRALHDWASRWSVDANQVCDVRGQRVISCILGPWSESPRVLF